MNNSFFDKVDNMFKEKLHYEEYPVIRIKDLQKNIILENINYDFVRFDSNFNFYKLQNDGTWKLVDNPNFKPVIKYKESFKDNPPI